VTPLLSTAEELPLRTASLDLVTAFNCVHHFDLGRFLTAVARVLAPGGQLFIYTRTPQQNARTIWGRYFPGFTEHEQRLHSEAAFRDAVNRTSGLTVVATQTFKHPRSSTAGRLRAQAEGRHYSTFSLYPPEELHAAIAAFLARLPSPTVAWVDEHLLVVVGWSRRNQVGPDGPGSLASRAITDQASGSAPERAGETPKRRPGGRTQITPLCAQSIAGDDLRQSAQIGGDVRLYHRSIANTLSHSVRSYLTDPEAPDRRIFICGGRVDHPVVCVQITRLWRAPPDWLVRRLCLASTSPPRGRACHHCLEDHRLALCERSDVAGNCMHAGRQPSGRGASPGRSSGLSGKRPRRELELLGCARKFPYLHLARNQDYDVSAIPALAGSG